MSQAVEIDPSSELDPVGAPPPAVVHRRPAGGAAVPHEVPPRIARSRRIAEAAATASRARLRSDERRAAPRPAETTQLAYHRYSLARLFTLFFAILAAALMHHGATSGDPHLAFFFAGVACLAIVGGILAVADRALRDRVESAIENAVAGARRSGQTASSDSPVADSAAIAAPAPCGRHDATVGV